MFSHFQLQPIEWNEAHAKCFNQCKNALQSSLELAHPDISKRLRVFTDTSDAHWGAAITGLKEHLSRCAYRC